MKNYFTENNSLFRYFALVLAVLTISSSVFSCKGGDEEDLVGNWVNLSSLSGKKRTAATGATVTDADGTQYGIVGTGMDTNGDRLADFWAFDPTRGVKGSWEQIEAEFPGAARSKAISFAIGTKFYVGGGMTDKGGVDGVSTEFFNDFYVYDIATETWETISPLPIGYGLAGSVAFAINGKGYVGLGYDIDDNEYKNFYIFDPAANTWKTEKEEGIPNYPGNNSKGAACFVIKNVAYVGAGSSNNSSQPGFYSFDPAKNDWNSLHVIITDKDDNESKDDNYASNILRSNTATFVIDGKGYFATSSATGTSRTVWEYTPSTDSWIQKADFEGSARTNAVGLTINNMGFVTTGNASSSVYNDIWRFEPNTATTTSDNY